MDAKQVALLLAIITAASVIFTQVDRTPEATEFEAWKSQFSIKYESSFENAYRQKIFLEKSAKIALHNSDKYKTYEMGHNQFSALTQEEFEQQYLGLVLPESYEVTNSDNDYI